MRSAKIQRDTKETQIRGSLKVEGRGRYEISTGIRFFDHMLELFTKHGGFDLTIQAMAEQRETFRANLAESGIDTGIHWQPGHWFTLLKDCRRGDLSAAVAHGADAGPRHRPTPGSTQLTAFRPLGPAWAHIAAGQVPRPGRAADGADVR